MDVAGRFHAGGVRLFGHGSSNDIVLDHRAGSLLVDDHDDRVLFDDHHNASVARG